MGRRFLRGLGAIALAAGVLATSGVEPAPAAPATTTLTGWLRVVAHDAGDGRTKVAYTLETTAGVKTLKLPASPPATKKERRAVRAALKANADRYVNVTARSKPGGTFAALSVTPIIAPPPPVEPPPLTPRPLKVAFLVVHWSGVGMNGVADPNAVRQWALTDPASLAAYYRGTSTNVIQISGDVISVTLPGGPDVATTCVPFEHAVNTLKASPYFALLASYNHVMMLSQFTGPGNTCGHVGSGNLRGRYTVLSGDYAKSLRGYVAVGSHELGHNLGLLHSGVVRCGQVPPTDACMDDEIDVYGDPFDAMGNSSSVAQFSAVHKNSLGLLAPASIVSPPKGTTQYMLRSSDAPGLGGVPLLRVPRPGTDQTYNFEIRGPSAPWGPYRPSDPVANGLSVRITMASGQVLDGATTVLIDMRPDSATAYDAPVLAGQTFVDAAAGVRVTVHSAAQGWANVTITR